MQEKKKKIALLILLWNIFPITVFAGALDELLMPGPVIQGHENIERKCESCHAKLDKKQQDKLCMDCHDHSNIKRDIQENRGFHGKNPAVAGQQCNHCHIDHIGRNGHIVLFNPETFEHKYTDYKLLGGHRKVHCIGCHQENKKYSETKNQCVDCHQKIDPHMGDLGNKCQECHKEDSWLETSFDHGERTKYRLDGGHADINCKLCHAGEKYKKTPNVCVACHLINDAHRGAYGKECEKCHTTESWEQSNFDHAKQTKFKLKGRHKKTNCDACHKEKLFEKKPGMACITCHQYDDDHKGRNGVKCQNCHDSISWDRVRFKHDIDTEFPLNGKHSGLACGACHRESTAKTKLKMECVECHRNDDVHNNEMGLDCVSCHNETSWNENVFFDHDLARFPLIGQHSAVACEECHLTHEYQDTELKCSGCHDADDIHNGALGAQCNVCHNPNGWNYWTFDHDQDTDYRLVGKHVGLSCSSCHSEPVPAGHKMEKNCSSCHKHDDKHRGEFGRSCEKCHSPTSFADVIYSR